MRNDPNQIGAPATRAEIPTLRTDGKLPFIARAVYIHTDGNMDWETLNGGRHVTPVKAGSTLCVRPERIYSGTTTCTLEIWG